MNPPAAALLQARRTAQDERNRSGRLSMSTYRAMAALIAAGALGVAAGAAVGGAR